MRMGRHRRWWIAGGLVAVVLLIIGLALFQPWKLWIDDRANEAVPVGAKPVVVAATTIPTTAPSNDSVTTSIPTVEVTVESTTTTTMPPVEVRSEFVSRNHGTSGSAVLLQDDSGRRFIRLENLNTSNGPDLFVYLSVNPHNGPEGKFDDDYVNLGRLEGNIGNSNYAIPPGTDLSRYASVVIWCDRFNSVFGAAPFHF